MRRLRLIGLAIWLSYASLAFLAAPRLAVACSCVAWDLREQVANGAVVLEGTVVGRDGNGVRVAVERWFAGPGRALAIKIAGDFDRPGVSSSCSVGDPPPAGSRWVWVAWPHEESGDLGVSGCSPLEQWLGPRNQLHDEAVATFGQGWTPGAVVAPEPEAPLLPLLAAVAVTGVGVATLIVVLALLARRGASGP